MARPRCPECLTEYVKPVHRESLQERLLSFLYVYPFCCQLCEHRFKFLYREVNYLRAAEDRRTYERLPMNCPITFSRDGFQSRGSIEDISMVGCKMLCEEILAPGAILQMSLHVSDSIPPVRVHAGVVRNVRRRRAGVEFLQLKKTERDRLRDFIQASWARRQVNETIALRGIPGSRWVRPTRSTS